MLVTLDGIITDVNPPQPRNAKESILVTLNGIVTDVSPVQYSKAS